MAKFFDLFPLISYDIARSRYSNYELVTDIFLRVAVIKEVLENISSYYEYVIRDDDKPEILAEKVYGDPEAHWIILLANNMIDPQYDWPLNDRDFNKYVVGKYGSLANAKTSIHHYEKVVTRTENSSGVVSEFRYIVDFDSKTNSIINIDDITGSYSIGEAVYQGANLAYSTFSANVTDWNVTTNQLTLANSVGQLLRYNNLLGDSSSANGVVTTFVYPLVPYEYYLSLPDEQSVSTYDIKGSTVTEIISRNAVTNYDYELEMNENRRFIKIIKPEYYGRITSELATITGSQDRFLRRLT
jgi:hypothetical protein